MTETKFKTSNIILTDADFDKKEKAYIKNDVKLNYYDFDSITLRMYDHPDKNMIGELHIGNIGKFTLWENDWEFGKYLSGTVEKWQLYFNVKLWLARRWESAPINLSFREAILSWDNKEIDKEQVVSDDDLPF